MTRNPKGAPLIGLAITWIAEVAGIFPTIALSRPKVVHEEFEEHEVALLVRPLKTRNERPRNQLNDTVTNGHRSGQKV